MVFTDPPYNVPIDGNVCGLGRVRHKEFAMASGEMSEAEFSNFLEAVLTPATAEEIFSLYAFFVGAAVVSGGLLPADFKAAERLNEEFKRRIKTQTVLPCPETVPMLLWVLIASGQIQMRKVDGWETLDQLIADETLDRAA